MERSMVQIFATWMVPVVACAACSPRTEPTDRGVTDLRMAGAGGRDGSADVAHADAAAADAGCDPAVIAACEYEGMFPECCCGPDRYPCRDLPQADCAARPYCIEILGVRVEPSGHPLEVSRGKPLSFVACKSGCWGWSTDAETCAYHPDRPGECFYIPSGTIPDEWIELFSCGLPPGLCGR